MSIQKFPLATIQKVRTYIANTLNVQDSDFYHIPDVEDGRDLPEPESLDDLSGLFTFGGTSELNPVNTSLQNQWVVSTVNPGAALLKLPGLRLKPTYRLVSYLYRSDENSAGVVWAVPIALSTTAHLERALTSTQTLSQLPRPEGALSNFMDAIEGDRSSASFIVASILRRELQEFGGTGTRRNWTHHRFIDAIPGKINWKWRIDAPSDFFPKVKRTKDDQAIVEYFTCRVVAPVTIYQHTDRYPSGSYKPNCVDQSVAVAHR
jgi:hypothetical protein